MLLKVVKNGFFLGILMGFFDLFDIVEISGVVSV